MAYILGFDIGTTASKAVITDAEGRLHAKFSHEHEIMTKQPGWQEESMEMWWQEFCQAMQAFHSINSDYTEKIEAIGITGLIPAMCAVDKHGDPIEPAILHTDVRAEEELSYLNSVLESPLSHAFMLPKVLWVQKNQPDKFRKINKIMAPHNYLVFRLTGKATIDYDTSWMIGGVFDDEKLAWNDDRIRELKLPTSIFPEISPANRIAGTVESGIAKQLNINPDAKVIVGVGDTFASILGGGAQAKHHLMIYLGTSATTLYTEGDPRNYLDTPHYGPGKAQFIGRILSYGETVNHWRNIFAVKDWQKLDQSLLEDKPGTDNLWYFPHFKMQGERSFFGLDAEHLLGLRGSHDQFAIYRAVIEGIARNIKSNVDSVKQPIEQINVFGGGAKSSELVEILAAVLNRPLTLNPKSSTALGIAFLAGLSAGIVDDFDRLTDVWFKDSREVLPREDLVSQYRVSGEKYELMRKELASLDRLLKDKEKQ